MRPKEALALETLDRKRMMPPSGLLRRVISASEVKARDMDNVSSFLTAIPAKVAKVRMGMKMSAVKAMIPSQPLTDLSKEAYTYEGHDAHP